jgi:hypothetical protein
MRSISNNCHNFDRSISSYYIDLIQMSDDYAPSIPGRVAEYADTVKQKFIDNATAPTIHERNEPLADLPVLPAGITRQKFNDAIEELRDLVDNHVQIHDGPLDDGWYLHRPLTHDAYPLQEKRLVSSATCAPGSVAQVQAVVLWANKWLIPILALSLGRNLGQSSMAIGLGISLC